MTNSIPCEFAIAIQLLSALNAPISPSLLNSIRHASYAGTLSILRNGKDDPIGFVCWAGGNKESIQIAHRFNLLPSRYWEFKEGKIAMVLFVYFRHPFNEQARRSFKDFIETRRAVYYVKNHRKRLLVRTRKGFKTISLSSATNAQI